MSISRIPRRRLATDRLILRPTNGGDGARAFEIQSDWEVARMLSRASFPPDLDTIRQWFAGHEREWASGEAYRFAVEKRGRFIGLVDIDNVRDGEGELGYWFEQSAWGQGYASEAAAAVIRFAFSSLRLQSLRAGHAADNAASQSILLKLGFQPLDSVERMSRSRGEVVAQQRYVMFRASDD